MQTRSPEAQLAAQSPPMSPMSPMTPSTPPYRTRSFAGAADHGRRLTDYGADGDTMMHSRVSMDSNASTVIGEDNELDERNYAWTEDQVAILVRVSLVSATKYIGSRLLMIFHPDSRRWMSSERQETDRSENTL